MPKTINLVEIDGVYVDEDGTHPREAKTHTSKLVKPRTVSARSVQAKKLCTTQEYDCSPQQEAYAQFIQGFQLILSKVGGR